VCIVGLGWGRSTSAISVAEAVQGEVSPTVSLDALAQDSASLSVGEQSTGVSPLQEQQVEKQVQSELFDPGTTVRVILMQNVVPLLATVGSYLTFLVLNVV
jgi:PiT family inorganic phosphate transporter